MSDKDDNDREMPGLDPETLARAEQAVAALGDTFMTRIKSELIEIRTHLDKLAQAPEDPSTASIKSVFAFAHDMRGQGGSFGYPLLTEIGGSLSYFLEQRDCVVSKNDIAVLRAHLDAAAAVVSSTMSGDGDTARALITDLDALVRKRLTGQS